MASSNWLLRPTPQAHSDKNLEEVNRIIEKSEGPKGKGSANLLQIARKKYCPKDCPDGNCDDTAMHTRERCGVSALDVSGGATTDTAGQWHALIWPVWPTPQASGTL